MTRFFISILLIFVALAACTKAPEPKKKFKVALCTVATNQYDKYAKEMIETAREFFLKGHEVTFFVFTDGDLIKPVNDLVIIPQSHLGWPYVTLKRFHVYDEHRKLFKEFDYVFAIDADMRFVAPVGDEILYRTVGVARDVGKHITYERSKKSAAYVKKKKAKHYFAGAFYGGEREQFLKMVHKMKQRVDCDLKSNYIAIWHDESHLNRYFFDHPPHVLNTSYCYFENWDMPYVPKILAMDKNARKLKEKEAKAQ